MPLKSPNTAMITTYFGGTELAFELPLGEVFKLAVEWTTKGYKVDE